MGVEIECSWKSYFPDLWVEGFPNIDPDRLSAISSQCSEREQTLLPLLNRTVEVGVPKGLDRYWEFAFDPVYTPQHVINQIHCLQQAQLIPAGTHSMHITLGGIRATPSAYYLAAIAATLWCDQARIAQGYHPCRPKLSHGWARKGRAGVFEKEARDLKNGAQVAIEIRMPTLTQDVEVFNMQLNLFMWFADMVLRVQRGEQCPEWKQMVSAIRQVLDDHNLPDCNWEKPHMRDDIWQSYIAQFPSVQQQLLRCLSSC